MVMAAALMEAGADLYVRNLKFVEEEIRIHDDSGRAGDALNLRLNAFRTTLKVAPDYADAMFNLALMLQRQNQYAEAADYWRRYLASDRQSEWAARARRSLKFCEVQINLIASA